MVPAHELMEGPKRVLLPHVKQQDRGQKIDPLRVANLHVTAQYQLQMEAHDRTV